jgi:hypothetical protein
VEISEEYYFVRRMSLMGLLMVHWVPSYQSYSLHRFGIRERHWLLTCLQSIEVALSNADMVSYKL